MSDSLFSERYGYAPEPTLKANDHLPGWVREAITNEVRGLVINKPSALLPDIDCDFVAMRDSFPFTGITELWLNM